MATTKRKAPQNAAKIRVIYPDGSRYTKELLPNTIPSMNILPFIKWLRDTAQELEDSLAMITPLGGSDAR